MSTTTTTTTTLAGLAGEIAALESEAVRRIRAATALEAARALHLEAGEFFSLAVGAGDRADIEEAGAALEAARAALKAAKAEAAPRPVGPVPAARVEAALRAAREDQILAAVREEAAARLPGRLRSEAARFERRAAAAVCRPEVGRGLAAVARLRKERASAEAAARRLWATAARLEVAAAK